MSLYRDIPGMMTEDECELLATYAAQAKNTIVEIGAYLGRSAVALAERTSAHVYSVDPFLPYTAQTPVVTFTYPADMYARYTRNLESVGLRDRVTVIRKPSAEAAQTWDGGEIDLLVIDALHDYENVKADFDAWSPFVTTGGVVMFHDNNEPGVQQLLSELPAHYEYIAGARLLVAYRKNRDESEPRDHQRVSRARAKSAARNQPA